MKIFEKIKIKEARNQVITNNFTISLAKEDKQSQYNKDTALQLGHDVNFYRICFYFYLLK